MKVKCNTCNHITKIKPIHCKKCNSSNLSILIKIPYKRVYKCNSCKTEIPYQPIRCEKCKSLRVYIL